ncbi:MAG: hypothetical protein R6V47_03980, partial [Candidatus Delongbacteria bacterium]
MPAERSSIQNNTKVLERKNISRILFAGTISVLCYLVIIVKLFNVQILNHEYYAEKYKHQSRKKVTVFAPRGDIYDRKYSKLAENIGINYAFGINTTCVKDKPGLAKRIASVTKTPYKKYLSELMSKDGFVWVASDLTENQRGEILNLLDQDESRRASFRLTPNRVYPQASTASHIIGHIDMDGNGVSGIEKEFHQYLTGTDGWEYI